jgi:hypothetical protein
MGLAEFGVATSANTEVLHEATYEPAHNHMGFIRPVPYDQLAVGMYTTRQFEGDDPEAAVEEFNTHLEETGQAEELTAHLEVAHLRLGNVSFRTVPADAPELEHALERLHHLLEDNRYELDEAWGSIIVTQNQENLKRVDVVLHWNEVETINGQPVFNSDGTPKLVLVSQPVTDETGAEVVDANGQPQTQEMPSQRFDSVHIFINRESGYYAH